MAGTLVTHITTLMSKAIQTFAHGLGVTPDYVVLNFLDATDTSVLGGVVTDLSTNSFSVKVAQDGLNVRASVIKVHSISA